MTTSSSDALPARSPMPLMVTSAWRAPARMPASELAIARPRSSWQCTEMMTSVDAGHVRRDAGDQRAELVGRRVADGVGDVERRRAGADRDVEHLVEERGIAAPGVLGRELDVAAERARVADHLRDAREHLVARHAQLVLHVEIARSRGRCGCAGAAPAHALPRVLDVRLRGARERADDRRVVQRPALPAPHRPGRRSLRTAARSSGEAAGKPASMTSTPSRASACATSSFSAEVIVAPGDCSPSRSVVSKIRTWVLVVVMASAHSSGVDGDRIEERHHLAQLGADLLDRVVALLLARCREARAAGCRSRRSTCAANVPFWMSARIFFIASRVCCVDDARARRCSRRTRRCR